MIGHTLNKLLLIVALFVSGPLWAQCPTSADLKTGIVLERTAPLFAVTMVQRGPGIQSSRIMELDGKTETVQSYLPHPLVTGSRKGANSSLSLDYQQPTSDLDRLNRSKKWVSRFTLSANGCEIDVGETTVTYKGKAREKIGSCQYNVWVVDAKQVFQENGTGRFRRFYAPGLGVVLRSVKLDQNGQAVSEVRYNKIEVAK